MESIDTLQKKTAVHTVIYGLGSVVAGGTGIAILSSGVSPILGIGLVLFGIAGFGWACVARDWFFKSKK